MLSLIGLILNTLGAFVILVPDIPRLYRAAHRLPPLETIEAGEKQLYHNGELQPDHAGFDRIAEAFLSGSPPLSDADRLDDAGGGSAMIRIGNTELKSEEDGFQVKRILRNEGDTISDSTYTIELYSRASLDLNEQLAEVGVDIPSPPYLTMESSQGAFPEYIEQYKRRLIFRMGALLLFLGFLLQALSKIYF